jgi:hypothetical protein
MRLTVSLPPNLYARIEKDAEMNQRSLSAQINFLLLQCYEEKE